uniref:Phosphofructokinase n=1 Tax=Candidatus Kentrum sp. DK TaxID=2126562 RepID=A0A450TIZ4_9GAMM|nr:MAG: fructose-1-phosphate kinase [Candidatus Kentron sp. DK]
MILSLGLTPAWQQILVFDSLQTGQVNRALDAHWCASGKVFNAGVAVHTLGGPGRVLAPAGGVAWDAMEAELRALGMEYRRIRTESATRVCTTLIDKATGAITELVEEGRPLLPEEWERFRAAAEEEMKRARAAVITGSLPGGAPVSCYRELLHRRHCPVVLDFRGEGLLSVLDREPLIVKPNREELEKTLGHPLNGESALIDAMRTLNRRGAGWVVVTQGPGPVLVSSATRIYRLHPLPVDARAVINPIGSGDAMAGAMAWIIGNRGKEDLDAGNKTEKTAALILEAVRWGIAAAAQNIRQLLPCRLDPAKLATEARGVSVERLA